LLKTAALGYAVLAANKIKMNEAEIKQFIEEMRYQVMVMPEFTALDAIKDYQISIQLRSAAERFRIQDRDPVATLCIQKNADQPGTCIRNESSCFAIRILPLERSYTNGECV
jgi:hypothetical protein